MKISKLYLFSVISLTLVLPVAATCVEAGFYKHRIGVALFSKWFIFFSVGVRLFSAGINQTINPSFTARNIFHIESTDSYVVVRELGFSNICFGLIGIISLFIPAWRMVSAVGSGLFYGIAGINHLIKKPVGGNEMLALVSDVFIFLVLAAYVCFSLIGG